MEMKHTFIRLLVLFCAGILVVSCREQKKSTPAGVDVKEVTFKEAPKYSLKPQRKVSFRISSVLLTWTERFMYLQEPTRYTASTVPQANIYVR